MCDREEECQTSLSCVFFSIKRRGVQSRALIIISEAKSEEEEEYSLSVEEEEEEDKDKDDVSPL